MAENHGLEQPNASKEPAEVERTIGEDEDRHSVISASSTESSVDPVEYEVDSIASSVEERLTWRGRMQVALHSHYFHIVIVSFVVLDALIVLFELLLDVGAFNNLKCEGEDLLEQAERCHYSMDFRDECSAPLSDERRVVPITNVTPPVVCTCKFRNGMRVCANFLSDDEVNPGLVLHGFSLAILCIFMIEIIVKLIAFRLKFFTHKFEVFDAIVVMESFILDVASLHAEESFEAFNLLIILRLWRVVRIVNGKFLPYGILLMLGIIMATIIGAILSSKAQADAQLEEVRGEARKTIHILHKLQVRFTKEMDEKDHYKELLDQNEIDVKTGKKAKDFDDSRL